MAVLVQAELGVDAWPLEATIVEPGIGALDRARDELVGVREIIR